MAIKPNSTKTQRLLQSFASVELRHEHRNYGDETPALRDFGIAPSIATALIRWGDPLEMVNVEHDQREAVIPVGTHGGLLERHLRSVEKGAAIEKHCQGILVGVASEFGKIVREARW